MSRRRRHCRPPFQLDSSPLRLRSIEHDRFASVFACRPPVTFRHPFLSMRSGERAACAQERGHERSPIRHPTFHPVTSRGGDGARYHADSRLWHDLLSLGRARASDVKGYRMVARSARDGLVTRMLRYPEPRNTRTSCPALTVRQCDMRRSAAWHGDNGCLVGSLFLAAAFSDSSSSATSQAPRSRACATLRRCSTCQDSAWFETKPCCLTRPRRWTRAQAISIGTPTSARPVPNGPNTWRRNCSTLWTSSALGSRCLRRAHGYRVKATFEPRLKPRSISGAAWPTGCGTPWPRPSHYRKPESVQSYSRG